MLRALAARHPTPLTKAQAATLACLKPTGGGFRNYLSKLSTAGHIVRDGEFLRITSAGLLAVGQVSPVQSPKELLALWRDRMPGKARDMLELFAEGRVFTKAAIAQTVGLDIAGGGFRNYWSKLSSNGLIERAQGGFRAVASLRLR